MYVSSPLGYPGSIPENVMRTGTIMVMDPNDARHDITEANVERTVRLPVGLQPGTAPYSPPPQSVMTMTGFGAGVSDPSTWLWGLVGVLALTSGYVAFRRVRGRAR
jgi:hypothetical protein